MVAVQPGFGGGDRAFVPDQRFVNTGAVYVTSQQAAGAVVFGHQVAAVVGQVGDDTCQGGLPQAPCPVVGQTVGRAGFVGGRQLVVEVVGVGPHPVAAEVAVGVVA